MSIDYCCCQCGQAVVPGSTLCVDCLAGAVDYRTQEDRKKIQRLRSVIEALKESDKKKMAMINTLVEEGLEKDRKIEELNKVCGMYRRAIAETVENWTIRYRKN